ncbi:ABC-three component system middle component 6 [Pseudomonas sp. 13B_3.2_Bac1]|uniref:ABC-three component system middle component 6 n=1 Tax=Pseudomonas sp. 13B_3.2_Bac1 TaxID=2971623 RepID=UPI003965B66E
MITIDSDPILNPVYIGATILHELALSAFIDINIENLYEKIKLKLDISYEVFAYALDWLYIIGAINLNSNGCIENAIA